jgi:deoxyribodipyrimidine photolyase-related protein
MKKYTTLRLILGDQLNEKHAWLKTTKGDTLYIMMEVLQETNYVQHHIQKVVGFFLAMRHFAESLEMAGHQVCYLKLDDKENLPTISENLERLIQNHDIQRFEYQLPDEYRLDEQLKAFTKQLSIVSEVVDTEHFLTKRMDVSEHFKGKKTFVMESFYRRIRRKYGLLMEEDNKTPLTGKWNYDASNRKKLPKKIIIPSQLPFKRNVKDIVEMLREKGISTIGNIDENNFNWAVTRAEQLELLGHFVKMRLNNFGAYQDAMTERDTLLFHSKLSFGMNVKLISPLEVVQKAIEYWEAHQKTIDIAQIEGFVRQIIGWREYMRGIYWAKMPEFATLNYLEHTTKLPDFFWTGNTKMNCVSHSVRQSLDTAYAHHIQRLMVTGNFALLAGIHPDEVDNWYLGIYMDAIEWVEITNTRGMSQFADGGIVGTKPYISSANYIHKMGEYCSNCQYDRKLKYGKNACPFNSLYWDFYDRHSDKLRGNHRVSMMYRLLDKMDEAEKEKILEQAAIYKRELESL